MASAASGKSAGNVPPSSFSMHIEPPSLPTGTMTSSSSTRARTVSSPAHTPTPYGNPITTDDHQDNPHHAPMTSDSAHDHSQHTFSDNSRARRRSATTSGAQSSIHRTFSVSAPLGFFTRRRNRRPPLRPPNDMLGEVIEIGPEPGSRKESNANEIDEDEERERLRDAAAQALGLGLGRDSPATLDPTIEDAEQKSSITSRSTNPYILDPIPRIPPFTSLSHSPPSLVSLPNSHSQMTPSIAPTVSASSDIVPPYPSSLAALKPYIQTSAPIFKYHPPSGFLALTLNRRAKQWKLHYVVLTSPPPAKSNSHDLPSNTHAGLMQRSNREMPLRNDVLQVSNVDLMPLPGTRHSHLHLFKSASPAPEEVEIDRLEINEDSVAFAAEVEIAGKRDVVKVGGRDVRTHVGSGGASMKSTGSSRRGSTKADKEVNVEEMGRTMWLLKMADGPKMQQWIGMIKSAIFMQRAERARVTFEQPAHTAGPNMRADLNVLLSLRSQAFLPSIAVSSEATSSYAGYAASLTDNTSQVNATYPTQSSLQVTTQKPHSSYSRSSLTNTANPTSLPTPNPRYAEHVGAAPSHTSPESFRARTYPSPSPSGHPLPSLKNLFSPSLSPSKSGLVSPPSRRASSSRHSSRPPSPDNEKDIDPISDDTVSLGNRAAALLKIFRSSNRASNSHNPRTSVSGNSMMTTSARSLGIGTPISPSPYSDETVRGKPPGAYPASFMPDWSMNNGTHESTASSMNKQSPSGAPSLPPPPRHPRRPVANSTIQEDPVDVGTTGELNSLANGSAHDVGEGTSVERRPSSPRGLHTPSPTPLSAPTSMPSIPNNSSFLGGRPSSANSMASSYVSAEGDQVPEAERGNSVRRSRTVPKMLAPPNGPPPTVPPMRARSSSGSPSPILDQDALQRNGNGRMDSSSSATTTWGSQHPYSNRVSGSSAMSTRTSSTGHSFLGSKVPPPPPRPPPNFSPPPAPTAIQDGAVSATTGRESFISRSHRVSLIPPAAPPTQSLPPRPDEPFYRHRRSHSSEVKSTASLFPIPVSSTPSSFLPHPPAPPPSGPLPPTPDSDRDRPSSRNSRRSSLTHRLRILSSPAPALLMQNSAKEAVMDPSHRIGEPIWSHSDGSPSMFLNMSDTPITPAALLPLPIPSPLQPDGDDVEPTPLSPPPRRNSRNSKEIRVTNHDKDGAKLAPLDPHDSAVVLEHR